MGGMLAATFLAVFFVPLFYRVIAERKLAEKRSTGALFDEIRERHEEAHRKLVAELEDAGGARHGSGH